MHLHRFPFLRTFVQRGRWARRLPARRRLAFRRAGSFCLARVSASTATLMPRLIFMFCKHK